MPRNMPASALTLATIAVPTCLETEQAQAVLARIKGGIATYESIDYIYVLRNEMLVGVFSMHELFSAPPTSSVKEFMVTEVAYVHAQTDPEHVAELALAQSIKAVPVVRDDGIFVGAVLGDVVLRILSEDHRNYLYKLTGIALKKNTIHAELRVGRQIRSRIPWLILGLLGGVAGAAIVSYFERSIADQLFVAAFIPAIVYIADAVGNQTEMLVVRALGKRSTFSITRYLARELVVGLLISFILAALMFAVSFAWIKDLALSTVLASSIVATVLFSITFTVTLPWILKKLRFDPAVASGPLATVVCDISSVSIYLYIASNAL
jgi:magnesium transporter